LRAIFVLSRVSALVLLSLLLVVANATAQDTSERPEGVVCREPECDLRRSLPRNLDLPFEQHALYVERVQNTPASSLDPALGNVPFDVWLHANLQGYRWAGPGESFAFWALTYCDSASSAFPLAGGPDLCVEVSVPIVGDRQVLVLVRVGEVDTQSAVPRWRDILPVVHDVYINRLQEHAEIDSLDVPSLSAIHARLALRFDDWPTVDLKTTVSWTPLVPGTTARFTITVANVGHRDLDRALVNIYLAIPLNNEDMKEIRRDWWPGIPAGKAVSFDISARIGRGDVSIVADAVPKSAKRVREINSEDNGFVTWTPFTP
jgi:hypothetical protein